jgi:hypothetical protein
MTDITIVSAAVFVILGDVMSVAVLAVAAHPLTATSSKAVMAAAM